MNIKKQISDKGDGNKIKYVKFTEEDRDRISQFFMKQKENVICREYAEEKIIKGCVRIVVARRWKSKIKEQIIQIELIDIFLDKNKSKRKKNIYKKNKEQFDVMRIAVFKIVQEKNY